MLWRPSNKIPNLLPSVYLATFFLSLHYSISLYVDAQFLSGFFNNTNINIIYFLSSFFTIVALAIVPKLLEKYGNYALALAVGIFEIITLLSLSQATSPFLIALVFISHITSVSILSYNFDIFIEHGSKDETTGSTRGIFLTIMNLAVFFGPILAGFLLSNYQFWKIYLTSAILTALSLLVISIKLSKFSDPLYKEISQKEMFILAWKNKNIRFISIANFLLQFFYAWMVIYMAIYLSQTMHFDWRQISIIFGAMLLPFIFLQYPLGELADRYFGEKEILIIGFIITAFSTASISFLDPETSIYLWAFILFMTRVGAASVEIMTETYFFKQIAASDTSLISFFRHTRPLAFMIGALVATLCLRYVSVQYLFFILGTVLLFGVYFSFKIVDTK